MTLEAGFSQAKGWTRWWICGVDEGKEKGDHHVFHIMINVEKMTRHHNPN